MGPAIGISIWLCLRRTRVPLYVMQHHKPATVISIIFY